MSEKKGPFDAAIAVLKTELRECSPDEEDELCDFIQSLTDNQYEKGLWIAIHVLEAAGKVEKAKLMVYLNHAIDWKENDSYGPGSAKEDRQLRALLESLPDGGKK